MYIYIYICVCVYVSAWVCVYKSNKLTQTSPGEGKPLPHQEHE